MPSAAILAILKHDYKPTNIIANTVLLGVFTYTQRLKNRNFKYVKARGNVYVDTIGSLFYLTATTFHFLSTHLLYEHGPLSQVSLSLTIDEVKKTVESMNNKKAPGDDGITGDIYNYAFKTLPKYITAIYNGCLKNGIFPTRWKRAKLIPIIKPGCEKSHEVLKYRPISLLNIGGKVLEKLLINRINHHLFTNDYASNNQYGFMPQRNATDAAMAAREYIEEGFGNGEVVALVSLDVAEAFNSAWWPTILKTLRDCGCLRNLLNLTKSYFTNRVAILQTNNTIEAEITKGCPQGSCCSPGLWNIQYNTLLELNYTNRTKAIAFADDLILMKRGNSDRSGNIANVEMSKISTWAKANKIQFNERKSKVLLLTRRKPKKGGNWKYTSTSGSSPRCQT